VTESVSAALFVYDLEAESLLEKIREHEPGCTITAAAFPQFIANVDSYLEGINHILVAGPVSSIKSVLRHRRSFS
jgi:hypothetical protein